MTQLSFFAAAASEPRVDDLAGLLAGPGQAVLRAGEARISVVVGESWRADALAAALDGLGLPPEVARTASGAVSVRSPFTARLLPLVQAWHPRGRKVAPAGLTLDGASLRWWCVAGGSAGPGGYLLRLGANDEPVWEPVGRALAAAGVAATLLGPRAGGPAYRVPGRRRSARLGELAGARPPGAPPDAWPG